MHSISRRCGEGEALLEASIAPNHFARALIKQPGQMDLPAQLVHLAAEPPQSRFLVPEGLAGRVIESVRRHDAKVREGLAGPVGVGRPVVVETSY